jgi:hypothetical protein
LLHTTSTRQVHGDLVNKYRCQHTVRLNETMLSNFRRLASFEQHGIEAQPPVSPLGARDAGIAASLDHIPATPVAAISVIATVGQQLKVCRRADWASATMRWKPWRKRRSSGFFACPNRAGKLRLTDAFESSRRLHRGQIRLKLGLVASERMPVLKCSHVFRGRVTTSAFVASNCSP